MKFTLGLFIVISVVVSQICLAHGENERETFEAEDNDPRDDFNDDQGSDSNDDQGSDSNDDQRGDFIDFEEPQLSDLNSESELEDPESQNEPNLVETDSSQNEVEKRSPWGTGGWGSRRRSSWGSRRRSWASARRRRSWASRGRRRSWASRGRRRSWASRGRRRSWASRGRRRSWGSRGRRRSWTSKRRRTWGGKRRRRRFGRRRKLFRRMGSFLRRRRRGFWTRNKLGTQRLTKVTKKLGGWLTKKWKGLVKKFKKISIKKILGKGKGGGSGNNGGDGNGGDGSGGGNSGGGSHSACDKACKKELQRLVNFLDYLEKSYCAFYAAKKKNSQFLNDRQPAAKKNFETYITKSLELRKIMTEEIKLIDKKRPQKTTAQLNTYCMAPCKKANTATPTKVYHTLKCAIPCNSPKDSTKCKTSDDKLVDAAKAAAKAYEAKLISVSKNNT